MPHEEQSNRTIVQNKALGLTARFLDCYEHVIIDGRSANSNFD